jgi:hypothetical protein
MSWLLAAVKLLPSAPSVRAPDWPMPPARLVAVSLPPTVD